MSLYGVIPFAHHLLEKTISPGDTVVDATVGNGHDTVILARNVGLTGRVIGFDIQHAAIRHTWTRLQDEQLTENVDLHAHNHACMENIFKIYNYPPPTAAIFNLGYLPGSDKTEVTKGTSTIAALTQLLALMPSKGLIVLVIYHGHEEGKKERDDLLTFADSLDQHEVLVAQYTLSNRSNHPPFLLALEKQ